MEMSNTDNLAALQARLEALETLCGAAYQLAGTVGAPERWLDALAAGANGDPIPEGELLPISADDCTAVAELHARLDQVRRAVAS
jgi:hypothetical protein